MKIAVVEESSLEYTCNNHFGICCWSIILLQKERIQSNTSVKEKRVGFSDRGCEIRRRVWNQILHMFFSFRERLSLVSWDIFSFYDFLAPTHWLLFSFTFLTKEGHRKLSSNLFFLVEHVCFHVSFRKERPHLLYYVSLQVFDYTNFCINYSINHKL